MPRLCDFETCRKQASYGEYYGKPLRCKDHKEEYKLVSQLCQEDNCKLYPAFNYENEAKSIYCFGHKKENMINKHKPCKFENCTKQPHYNFADEKIGIYCSLHKLSNMINVTSKKCEYEKCNKCAICNYEGEKIVLYCAQHKLENMVNIKSKKCEYIDCKTLPTYNYIGEITAIYCCEHKLENMIDVIHKTCNFENCKIRPCYNYSNETIPIYCAEHKTLNMIDIIGNTKCKANFCLGARANVKYKGYCRNCYQHLFPNDPLTYQIRSKTKEIAVRDYINQNFKGFQHDKPLWSGNCDCTHRRRIDHRVLIGNTLLCIETDENQHKSYDETDEEIRYDDLYMLHSGKFIYIRFNPDKFKNKNGKSLNPMLYTRLPVLKEEIEKQIERIKNEENIELLEIIKLYYNE